MFFSKNRTLRNLPTPGNACSDDHVVRLAGVSGVTSPRCRDARRPPYFTFAWNGARVCTREADGTEASVPRCTEGPTQPRPRGPLRMPPEATPTSPNEHAAGARATAAAGAHFPVEIVQVEPAPFRSAHCLLLVQSITHVPPSHFEAVEQPPTAHAGWQTPWLQNCPAGQGTVALQPPATQPFASTVGPVPQPEQTLPAGQPAGCPPPAFVAHAFEVEQIGRAHV